MGRRVDTKNRNTNDSYQDIKKRTPHYNMSSKEINRGKNFDGSLTKINLNVVDSR